MIRFETRDFGQSKRWIALRPGAPARLKSFSDN
jgi:hypothetical protein